MAMTPASGVPTSTRSGDLDPGLAMYLAQTEGMSATQFHHMVNHESGLLGMSQRSADMRTLLELETRDVACAEAVAVYCYRIATSIGALATALNGLDTLVFSGGIGENLPQIRARVCERLAFLGLHLEAAHNASNLPLLSSADSRVTVRMIRTDEEAMIARHTLNALGARGGLHAKAGPA
jgi:acetate kinase